MHSYNISVQNFILETEGNKSWGEKQSQPTAPQKPGDKSTQHTPFPPADRAAKQHLLVSPAPTHGRDPLIQGKKKEEMQRE